jgi:integrase
MKGCRVLEAEEIQGLLEELPPRDRLLLLTGLTFGTRISEALKLTFGDVAGRFLYLDSAKGSEKVTFEIPLAYRAEVATVQAAYEAAHRPVFAHTPLFLSRKGSNKPISRQQASDIITAACQQLGIEGRVNTHSLRKCFVTQIYELSGKDLAQTQRYSRHKNLANLHAYIRTAEDLSLVHALHWQRSP